MTTNAMMRTTRMSVTVLVLLASAAGAAGPPAGPLTKCPPDSVVAGTTCMDKYEASAWRVPNPTTTNAALVKKIQQGKATAEALAAAGATQVGLVYPPPSDWPCSRTGQAGCGEIFAVSIAGVMPSAFGTWFMAQEACTNSRKRLPTSAEWQAAANGTPDPNRFPTPTNPTDDGTTDCNVLSGPNPVPTGSRSGCVSARGAFDMVGNVWEWVADWVTTATSCPGWGSFSDDYLCMSPSAVALPTPGGVVRGGNAGSGTAAGPLATRGDYDVGYVGNDTGFRCAR